MAKIALVVSQRRAYNPRTFLLVPKSRGRLALGSGFGVGRKAVISGF